MTNRRRSPRQRPQRPQLGSVFFQALRAHLTSPIDSKATETPRVTVVKPPNAPPTWKLTIESDQTFITEARTKSEARAKFKAALRVKRLPPHAQITKT